MHHTFADTEWGPDFVFLAEALYEKKAQPVIICESKGTMAEDALDMKQTYQKLLARTVNNATQTRIFVLLYCGI